MRAREFVLQSLSKFHSQISVITMADDQYLQHFQSLLGAGAGGAPSASVDDKAYLNGVFGGLSYRSLLAYCSSDPTAEALYPLKLMKTEPLFATADDSILSGEDPPYSFFSDVMPTFLSRGLPSLLSYEHPQNPADGILPGESPPYNFFSDVMPPPPPPPPLLHQLPRLLSYEQPHISAAAADKSPIPNPRYETAPYGKQKQRCNRRQEVNQQRKRLSDMTRRLQKLLPWDEKMDMARVLEEAYKYIKFLQAQVSVLQSMPRESSASTAANGGGELGRLNRQQLLQVVVNSPAVQTQLYSKECCLYSIEQLMMLKKNAERHHQMMLHSSANPNFYHSSN